MALFPSTIAMGDAFCNRDKERQLLKQYIKHQRHVVLMAPRRYGKTSLINQVLIEQKSLYGIMELTMATSIEDVERIILKYVGQLLHSLLPKTIKAKQSLLKLFKWLNPEIVLTVAGQKLIFHPDQTTLSPTENISEMLIKLDSAAKAVEKNVVLCIDEFQQITEIKPDYVIEAAIRHAMQYSKHVSYIFSGSNRHLLLDMFNDKNRPFYNSCEIMQINRIAKADYELFIQKAAEKQWKKQLSESVLEAIFRLSELHPSYINRICGYFWLTNEFPSQTAVEQFWENFVKSKHAELAENVLKLSKNQKKVLLYLAHHPTPNPSSHEVCQKIELSEASTRQAVQTLLLKDYLFKDDEGLVRVLDPALKYFLQQLP